MLRYASAVVVVAAARQRTHRFTWERLHTYAQCSMFQTHQVNSHNDADGSNKTVPRVPLGRPVLRQWELTAESSKYEKSIAAPSDHDLVLMWTIWGTLLSILSLILLVIFLAVMSSKKARRNSFNLYLLFMIGPNMYYSSQCAITCAWNAILGHYQSSPMCLYQSWYLIFGSGANSWMIAVIAYELHRLLRFSRRRQRYFPPRRARVVTVSLLVYAWVAFLAFWGILSFPWLPHDTNAQNGAFCIPIETNRRGSQITGWLLFLPLLIMIPFAYTLVVIADVVWNKLLPQRGAARVLAVYFFRLAGLYALTWAPTFVVLYAVRDQGPWVTWGWGTISHLHGLLAALVALWKPDIAQAFRSFVSCRADHGCRGCVCATVNSSTMESSDDQVEPTSTHHGQDDEDGTTCNLSSMGDSATFSMKASSSSSFRRLSPLPSVLAIVEEADGLEP